MGYTIQAIIGSAEHLNNHMLPSTRLVTLNQGLSLIPLTDSACESVGLDFLPLTDGGFTDLPESFVAYCCDLSLKGKLAYIEAEIFGGVGTQACVLFDTGRRIDSVTVARNAINRALRFLGAKSNVGFDEFESVGLCQQRNTMDWLRA